MSSNSTLLSSSVTSNTSPTSTSLSTATEITTDVNVCRFCLHSGSNKLINNVCECTNPRLSFSHLDCLQTFCRRFRKTYCECCQKDFILIINNYNKMMIINDDDGGGGIDNDNFRDKFRKIFHTIINVEVLQDEFYYLLSSIIDLFIVTILLAIIIGKSKFLCPSSSSSSTKWQTIICQPKSTTTYIICIYLIVFLFMKYCYHINRFKQFFKRIKKFL
ncbi:uncharacterized protein LOC124496542 [Dermatophagoides farinae]|uniref:RING-CH-type domain-containing protein n=1 Tax=Dermatophagoides farinae TaxID=6954 RepID=A0A922L197_DERFA|nr:uncharacterized protein LOC124496542 [Dermatophagoides farinae]KAH9501095.1 hypothetical protein DERF_011964 [Dermatophagoides farinae]